MRWIACVRALNTGLGSQAQAGVADMSDSRDALGLSALGTAERERVPRGVRGEGARGAHTGKLARTPEPTAVACCLADSV